MDFVDPIAKESQTQRGKASGKPRGGYQRSEPSTRTNNNCAFIAIHTVYF